jgi:hypothetical protein
VFVRLFLQVTGPQRLQVVLGMFSREFVADQILGEDTAMLEHGFVPE